MLSETEEHRKKEIISLDSFESWLRLWLQDRRREAKEKAHEFFVEMDRDGSGSLDKDEVARVGRYVIMVSRRLPCTTCLPGDFEQCCFGAGR